MNTLPLSFTPTPLPIRRKGMSSFRYLSPASFSSPLWKNDSRRACGEWRTVKSFPISLPKVCSSSRSCGRISKCQCLVAKNTGSCCCCCCWWWWWRWWWWWWCCCCSAAAADGGIVGIVGVVGVVGATAAALLLLLLLLLVWQRFALVANTSLILI